jgi:hypothetical protein
MDRHASLAMTRMWFKLIGNGSSVANGRDVDSPRFKHGVFHEMAFSGRARLGMHGRARDGGGFEDRRR